MSVPEELIVFKRKNAALSGLLALLMILQLFLPLPFLRAAEMPLPPDDESTAYADHLCFGIPSQEDILLQRRGFALGYSKKYRQAAWISYILSSGNLTRRKRYRRVPFRPDPDILFAPVRPRDYTSSGYDRGHLAPVADMDYSAVTIRHSFFMTNISPQLPGCNRGIWKRVETQVRKWALKEKSLYIVTGPIFDSTGTKTLENSDLPVPCGFYKVIYDMTPPSKMIAFIVPNQTSRRRVKSFVVTVDEVEKVTGYDFFSRLPDDVENALESAADFDAW